MLDSRSNVINAEDKFPIVISVFNLVYKDIDVELLVEVIFYQLSI